jgi:rubrerythrin
MMPQSYSMPQYGKSASQSDPMSASYMMPQSYSMPQYDGMMPQSDVMPASYAMPQSYTAPQSYNMPQNDMMPQSNTMPASYTMPESYAMQDPYNIPATYPKYDSDPGSNMSDKPQWGMDYADPPASTAMSPEMQEFMEQGYLMGPDCFGSDAQQYANVLMEYINDEYRDYLYYNMLARRATTNNARRVFRSIAQDELKHAHRWAAAYFLITGKKYFPTRRTVELVTLPSNYSLALRDRYLAESRDAVKYRQFAASTTDRCLKRMATDTSDDERQHAQDLLGLIQGM